VVAEAAAGAGELLFMLLTEVTTDRKMKSWRRNLKGKSYMSFLTKEVCMSICLSINSLKLFTLHYLDFVTLIFQQTNIATFVQKALRDVLLCI